MQLEAATGAMVARRSQTELGTPRYLLAAGAHVVAVGESRLATLPASDFERGPLALSREFGSGVPTGRAVVSGEGDASRILWPLGDELAVIKPGAPEAEERLAMPDAANILVAGDTGARSPVVLSAGTTALRSMLSWDAAGELLEARMACRPQDAGPLLTAIELFHKVGMTDRAPGLADRVLELASRVPEEGAGIRSRLLERLLLIVAQTRDPGTDEASRASGLELLDQLLSRAARAADLPVGQARVLLDRAWLREAQGRPADAAEALQEILAARTLGESELVVGSAGTEHTTLASDEATRALRELLVKHGPGPYAAFDEEARSQLAAIPAGAPGSALAQLAARYPVAASAAEAWARAGEAFDREKNSDQGRLALGRGLAAAELGAAIGRTDQGEVLARLASAMVLRARDRGTIEPVYRLLRRLAAERSTPSLSIDGSPRTAQELALELGANLASRGPLPSIGTALSGRTQVIEGFTPAAPVDSASPGLSHDSVAMVSLARGELALFAVSAHDDQLAPIWTRSFKHEPRIVRTTPDRTIVLWPTPGGGWLEAISPEGATLWKTREFAEILSAADPAQGAAAVQGVTVVTPLDGPVGIDDLVVTADARSILIGRRSGGLLCLDIENGTTRFAHARAFTRVYDVALAPGGQAVVSGAILRRDEAGPERLFASLASFGPDGTSLARLGPEALGDHGRWIQPILGDTDVLVGTADGVFRLDPASGALRWKTDAVEIAGSLGGVIAGGSSPGASAREKRAATAAFVLDATGMGLRRLSLADGALDAEPADMRGRMAHPATMTRVDGAMVIATSQGLLALDEEGRTIGADGLDAGGRIEPAVLGDGVAVIVEASGRETQSDTGAARIYFLETPSGRLRGTASVLLMESPRQPLLIENKILISQGPVTLVFDAPR
jgi:outer membrane protein assembly factor BamB